MKLSGSEQSHSRFDPILSIHYPELNKAHIQRLEYVIHGESSFYAVERHNDYAVLYFLRMDSEIIADDDRSKLAEFLRTCGIRYIGAYLRSEQLIYRAQLEAMGMKEEFHEMAMSYTGTAKPEPDIDVRHYTDTDFEEETRIEGQAFEPVRRQNNQTPYNWFESASKEELEAHRRFLAERAEDFFIVMQNNRIAGGTFLDGDSIEFLFVGQEFQRRGLGRLLTELSINRIFERGHTKAKLMVLGDNEPAQMLYLSCGFKIDAELFQFRGQL